MSRAGGGRGGRLPLMAGTWKMNLTHLEAIALVQKLAFTLTGKDFDATEVAVLPPFTALRSVQTLVAGDKLRIRYGAQDISVYDAGAYTGEVSGPMLAKLGCAYVLAGHSERRQYHGEDDAAVNAKTVAAMKGVKSTEQVPITRSAKVIVFQRNIVTTTMWSRTGEPTGLKLLPVDTSGLR